MRPMLDDIELPQVQTIMTREGRALAEHVPPGGQGSVLQNLGRAPLEVQVVGVVTGDGVATLHAALDAATRNGAPLTFVADVTTTTSLEQVVVEDLTVTGLAGRPGLRRYELLLREYVEPPPAPPGAVPSAVDGDLLAEATDLVDGIAGGLDIALELSTGLERFLPDLTALLARLRDLSDRVGATR